MRARVDRVDRRRLVGTGAAIDAGVTTPVLGIAEVLATASEKDVATALVPAAAEKVAPATAADDVVARTAHEQPVSVDAVIARSATDVVVALTALDIIGVTAADQEVVTAFARELRGGANLGSNLDPIVATAGIYEDLLVVDRAADGGATEPIALRRLDPHAVADHERVAAAVEADADRA